MCKVAPSHMVDHRIDLYAIIRVWWEQTSAHSDCTIDEISDIGEVKNSQCLNKNLTEINHVCIVGVPQLGKYEKH